MTSGSPIIARDIDSPASDPARDSAIYTAGDIRLQSGRRLRNARISYKTYGAPNADRSNVILYPTSFNARHSDSEQMIGTDRILDPSRYFIIVTDLFGNGLSSSPSNTPWPDVGSRYPDTTMYDAAMVQRRMLTELWGIEKLALVYGWSMGGMQAYHWAALFPDLVERIAVVCGSAKCSPHNAVFIEGVKHALMADASFQDGEFVAPPLRGNRAMGRVYAGWAMSQTFYRRELWRVTGATSLDDYLVADWDTAFAGKPPADLLAQLWTWQNADISANELYRSDLPKALGAIKAQVLLMPGNQDLYFQEDDNRLELEHLKRGVLKPIQSDWGHCGGFPVHQPEDMDFLGREVRALLES